MVLISDTDDYDGNNKDNDDAHKYVDDMMMMMLMKCFLPIVANVECRSLHRKICARLHSIQPLARRVSH